MFTRRFRVRWPTQKGFTNQSLFVKTVKIHESTISLKIHELSCVRELNMGRRTAGIIIIGDEILKGQTQVSCFQI